MTELATFSRPAVFWDIHSLVPRPLNKAGELGTRLGYTLQVVPLDYMAAVIQVFMCRYLLHVPTA